MWFELCIGSGQGWCQVVSGLFGGDFIFIHTVRIVTDELGRHDEPARVLLCSWQYAVE